MKRLTIVINSLKPWPLRKVPFVTTCRKTCPRWKTQTCLIWGENNVTPPEVADEFNKLLPNADLFWIEKCGHAPMMEHPDRFNEILHDWLKSKEH